MAGRQRCDAGGIRSLRELIGSHSEAVEFDLIGLGLRLDWLGSESLSWRDLWVIVRQSPRTSALFRATNPDAADWGLAEQLTAAVFDAVQVGNWQRASGKRHERPRPIPRPGVEPEGKTFGSTPIPMHEMAERLGWTTEEAPSE